LKQVRKNSRSRVPAALQKGIAPQAGLPSHRISRSAEGRPPDGSIMRVGRAREAFHCYFHVFRTPERNFAKKNSVSRKADDIAIIYGFEISSNFDFFTL
jgi:hypothetical protein